jgi:hypothetical protein
MVSSAILRAEAGIRRSWSFMRRPKSPHTTVVPRVDPPVATCGRPLGDFDFSANFGVSQSSAGDVVEKHRAREKVASDPDRHVGRVQADRGPANIFI